MKEKQKKFEMPDTYVIVFCLLIFMTILTFIIPAGSYEMVENAAGQKVVDPNSFTFTEGVRLTLPDIFCSLYNGLKNGAGTIALVLIIGGAFQIILDTGAVEAMINVTINKLQNKAILVFPMIMLLMYFLGAVGIGINVSLAFIPIGIALCKKFRLDSIVAVAIFYLAANTGHSCSPFHPTSVLLGQTLAGVPYMSGLGLRMVVFVLVFIVFLAFVMHYILKVMKDPSRSLVGVYQDETVDEQNLKVTGRQLVVFVSMIAALAYYTWGAVTYNWGLDILCGILTALGLFAGFVGGMSPNGIAKSFANGCKLMTYSAVLIGLAGAISVVMTKGGIIHSVVYYLCLPLSQLPTVIGACGMYVANCVINVLIPSASGQCYVVMPLMAPMADVLGFSRQIAVSAFQLGDGFMNAIQPTTSLMMGCLGIAGVSYAKWLKFSLKIFAVFALISCAFLIFTVSIGWV